MAPTPVAEPRANLPLDPTPPFAAAAASQRYDGGPGVSPDTPPLRPVPSSAGPRAARMPLGHVVLAEGPSTGANQRAWECGSTAGLLPRAPAL